MRLFTGIAIPPPVTERLEQTLSVLRPSAGLRWSPLANLHITTKFIGAWREDRLGELQTALSAIRLPAPIEISVTRFGYYPNPHQPKIFFAGIRAPGLEKLNGALEETMALLGCPREDRPYSPHLTLARIGKEDIGGLRQAIAALASPEFGSFRASRFHMYQSQPAGEGSIYTPLASFDFTTKEAIAC